MTNQSVKFGVYLPTYGPEVSYANLRDIAQEAERCGFDSLWSCDHLVDGALIESQQGCPPDILECWTTLSSLAAVTNEIRLGTSVIAIPFRNPALLGKMAASLDFISGGRLILGLGTGWGKEESEAYGITYETIQERFGRLEEAVALLPRIWQEEHLTFEGQYYWTKDSRCWPKPVRDTIPFWFGGVRKRARALVARHGAGWLPVFLKVDEFRDKAAALRDELMAVGRPVDEVVYSLLLFTSIDRDAAVARHECAAFVRDLSRHYVDGVRPLDAEATSLIGDWDMIVQRINEYRAAGCTYFILGFMPMTRHSYLKGIELYAQEVMPRLQG